MVKMQPSPLFNECADLFNISHYFIKKYIRNKNEFQNVKMIELCISAPNSIPLDFLLVFTGQIKRTLS